MTKYRANFAPNFKKDFKVVRKKHELIQRLENKIEEILENPGHYKNLRNVLKNQQRVHLGSFVLIFEVDESKKMIYFHSFKHHDQAYKSF